MPDRTGYRISDIGFCDVSIDRVMSQDRYRTYSTIHGNDPSRLDLSCCAYAFISTTLPICLKNRPLSLFRVVGHLVTNDTFKSRRVASYSTSRYKLTTTQLVYGESSTVTSQVTNFSVGDIPPVNQSYECCPHIILCRRGTAGEGVGI